MATGLTSDSARNSPSMIGPISRPLLRRRCRIRLPGFPSHPAFSAQSRRARPRGARGGNGKIMVGRNLKLLVLLATAEVGEAGAKSKEARRAFTRSDGWGYCRIKHDGWEAVTPRRLLIPRISNAGAASSGYLSGIAGRRLSVLLSKVYDNAYGIQRCYTQERLCPRRSEYDAARLSFLPMNSIRTRPKGYNFLTVPLAVNSVRHFPFCSLSFRVHRRGPSSPSLRYRPETMPRTISASPPGL